MMYKLLVIVHLLAGSVWVGGQLILARGVLPGAVRTQDPRPLVGYLRVFGPMGLIALVLLLATGLPLARHWVPSLSGYFDEPTAASRLVIAKLLLLTASLFLGGYAQARLMPELAAGSAGALPRFALVTRANAVLAVLLLVAGAAIRMGGLF